MKKTRFVFCIILLFASSAIFGQNSLSVSKRGSINMDFTPSNNAGQPKNVIIDDSQWLNYTTLVHPTEPNISITVEVAYGSIPDGMELQIEARPYVGMSKSSHGTPTGKIMVTNQPRVLIDNISTSDTGSGRNEGYQLIFSFIITDYSKVRSGISNMYVQYTITQ